MNTTPQSNITEEPTYEGIEPRYRSVQVVLTIFGYIILAGLALFLLLIDNPIWCIITETIITIALLVNIIILRKAWLFKGYALSRSDISYRSGLVFPTLTTIPFDRIQQVSVKQNPVSKFLRLYEVEVVNGAQTMASLTIPGLSEERAGTLRNILLGKISGTTVEEDAEV